MGEHASASVNVDDITGRLHTLTQLSPKRRRRRRLRLQTRPERKRTLVTTRPPPTRLEREDAPQHRQNEPDHEREPVQHRMNHYASPPPSTDCPILKPNTSDASAAPATANTCETVKGHGRCRPLTSVSTRPRCRTARTPQRGQTRRGDATITHQLGPRPIPTTATRRAQS